MAEAAGSNEATGAENTDTATATGTGTRTPDGKSAARNRPTADTTKHSPVQAPFIRPLSLHDTGRREGKGRKTIANQMTLFDLFDKTA